MNIQTLKRYIECIDSERPINLPKFISMIKTLSLSNSYMPSSVSARKIKGQLYLVTDIDKGLLSELKMIVDGIGKDRISSSRQNRSHLQKVDGSFLLIREGNSHPKVVLFNKEGQFSGVEQTSDSALLVENRQNFISIEKTLIFLEHEVGLNITAPIDVIFADENEISNSLHHDFLFHYKQLYLFFDLDLGGIIIARNINKGAVVD